MIHAYFDDSGSHDGSEAMSVAGFLYKAEDALRMNAEWQEVLSQYGFEVFHMVDFAPGKVEPYCRYSKEERIIIQKKLQNIIYRYAFKGLAVSVINKEFDDYFAKNTKFTNSFSLCCFTMIHNIVAESILAGQKQPNVAVFFERGTKNQSDADRIVKEFIGNSEGVSHAFVSKKIGGGPIQAADMFAWLHNNWMKRVANGSRKPREDFKALVETTRSRYVVLRAGQPWDRKVRYGPVGASTHELVTISGSFGSLQFRGYLDPLGRLFT